MVIGLLTACGGSPRVEPTPGVWDGYVFTSEYLGFRFVLPPGWDVAPDVGLALGGSQTLDMMVVSRIGVIQIFYTRNRHPGGRTPTFEELMRRVVEAEEAQGARVVPDSVGTVTLGNYEWNFFDVEDELMGMDISVRHLLNVRGAFLRRIIIAFDDKSDSIEDILAWFVGLDEPLPERR